MAKRGLSAEQYCDLLGKIIKRLGPKAYQHAGLIVLYSGPSDDIRKLLASIFVRTNWNLSKDQAERTGGVRLDETFMGRSLLKKNLPDYFFDVYAGDVAEIAYAVSRVWAFISREFVKAAFKHAATAACGADEKRVFRRHEMMLAIYNAEAETINSVPVARIREADKRGGEYAAFHKICQAELALARQWVSEAKPGADLADARANYRARRKFFVMERQRSIRGEIDPPLRAFCSQSGIHASFVAEDMPMPLVPKLGVGHPRGAGSHPH